MGRSCGLRVSWCWPGQKTKVASLPPQRSSLHWTGRCSRARPVKCQWCYSSDRALLLRRVGAPASIPVTLGRKGKFTIPSQPRFGRRLEQDQHYTSSTSSLIEGTTNRCEVQGQIWIQNGPFVFCFLNHFPSRRQINPHRVMARTTQDDTRFRPFAVSNIGILPSESSCQICRNAMRAITSSDCLHPFPNRCPS